MKKSLLIVFFTIFSIGCQIQVGPYSNKRVSENVAKGTYTLSLEPEEYASLKRIVIDSPTSDIPVRGFLSPTNEIKLSAAVLSESTSKFANFLRQIKSITSKDKTERHIDLNGKGIYMCRRTQIGGKISVDGTCIEEINVYLPTNSQTEVLVRQARQVPILFRVKSGKLIKIEYVGASINELIDQLKKASFSDDKINILRIYVSQRPGRIFTVTDVGRILDTFTFDKDDVCEVMSGRVIDTQNVYRLSNKFTFSSERERGLELLSR